MEGTDERKTLGEQDKELDSLIDKIAEFSSEKAQQVCGTLGVEPKNEFKITKSPAEEKETSTTGEDRV